MALSRRTKVVLTIVTAIVVALATVIAFGVYRRCYKFAVEDSIHGAFFPLVLALEEYEHDHGVPAASLPQLVPNYISQIRSSAFVDSVEYGLLTDGKAWQLRLHSTALEPPRAYVCRSSDKYTDDEEQRLILRYHVVWVVLRD